MIRPSTAADVDAIVRIYAWNVLHGSGTFEIGRLLLAALVARCETAGARQVLAVIGDSANAASIGLHRARGFAPASPIRAAGWQFDRWLDVVIMQSALGKGDAAATGPAA